MRVLIWLVIGLAVVVWLKRAVARVTHGTGPAGQPRQRAPKGESETMLQCAHCGVHFPASEAVTGAAGAVYCSADHRKLAGQ
ncbi:MAG: hypothetical protein JO002_10630 [Burkholderiaceae bacterium]|nr:hypothetical protein [Burkholderiaceae bacterium]